ncbi:hypothetical protein [Pedobacter sp. UBA4863]|uniref:hypothetical protein n=1 Tax=Pedobacter sp. UBA4863 TaxID=1947060 RepID=UPI0025F744A0|nr:hypothetical protein [Pedobacter sp. UBA4863]
MRLNKLILDYSKLSDTALNQKAFNVKNALTDNVNFPVTVPTLSDFTSLQQSFEEGITKSVNGDRIQIALKNQARAALLAGIRQLALNIDAQANGDRAKLLSSGFDLAVSNEHPSTITAPIDFKLLDGLNAGEMKFTFKRVLHAVSYLFELSDTPPDENTQWTVVPGATRTYTFKGLRSGNRIYGRVQVVGRKGQQIASEILSRVVQ